MFCNCSRVEIDERRCDLASVVYRDLECFVLLCSVSASLHPLPYFASHRVRWLFRVSPSVGILPVVDQVLRQ